MPSINLIRRLPPSLSAWLFYRGMPIALIARFLIGNIYGVFLGAICLYAFIWGFGGIKPLTLGQLLVWVDDLPIEAKTGLIAALLTIVGFLFAFHTATANWKAEALSNLKLHVATEIENFFAEASRLTSDAQIYADTLVNTVNKIQGNSDPAAVEFAVQWAIDRLPQFLAVRERLASMSIEVHRLSGKYFSVLATVPGATNALEDCAAAFTEITQNMWFHVPSIQHGNPNAITLFFSQVNVTQCSRFITSCEENFDRVNGLSGAVRGALLAPIIGLKLGTWTSMLGKKAVFTEALTKVGERQRNGS